jgi:fucose permease
MRINNSNNKWLALTYPWIIWTIAAGFFFYKYLIQVSPSVMTNDLMKAFQVNGAGLGNLSAFYFYAYLLMQIPVGMMLDKFSPR